MLFTLHSSYIASYVSTAEAGYIHCVYVTASVKTVLNGIFKKYRFEVLKLLWFCWASYTVAMLDLQYS